MPKPVDKLLEKLRTSLGKVSGFYPLSAARVKYLTSQVFFVLGFSTGFKQFNLAFAQLLDTSFNLLINDLYPVFTGSITNTKLIKELYS